MSNLTQKQRDKLPDSAFCGPNRTYPVLDSSDVQGVASLIGKAPQSEQDSIKACVIAKAKKFKWPIPKAWQDSNS